MKRFRWALALLQGAMLVLAMCLATPAYAEGAVAKIGETEYTTLEGSGGALESAQDGATITLQQNYTLGSTLEIKKRITLDLNGHTITCSSDPRKRIEVTDSGDLTITSTTKGKIVNSTSITTPPDSGKAPGLSLIKNQGTLTLEGDISIESDDTCIFANKGPVTINGSAVEVVSKYGNAIATNGSKDNEYDSSTAVVNISDGKIASTYDVAVYIPAGTFNISGGTITGKTGVYMKGGTLNITDGIISGTGEKQEYSYNGNGANYTGDALVVEVCGYPYGSNPAITVSGGTFTSTNAEAVHSYVKDSSHTRKTSFISGGTYKSKLENDDLLAEGFALAGNEGYQVAQSSTAVAKIDGNSYSTLKAAIEAATEGNTIVMQGDYLLQNDDVTINKNVTLDLNGYSIICTCKKEGSTATKHRLVIETGKEVTITGNSGNGAFGTIKNSVALADGAAASGVAMIKNQGTLTLKNINIESDDTCVWAKDGTLNIDDTVTITSKKGNAVATNGSKESEANYSNKAVVNITGGTITSTSDVAVYIPAGTFNISGGAITGATGIYMKGGVLNILNNPVVTGNGTLHEYVTTGDGAVPTGDALVIDKCGYPFGADPGISVTGGTFTSTNAKPVGSYKKADGDYTEKTGFLSGGMYSKTPDANLLAKGVHAKQSDNGSWGVENHTFDYTTKPEWIWRRINGGAWTAAAVFSCECGATESMEATVTPDTPTESLTTFTATVTKDSVTEQVTRNETKNIYVTKPGNAESETHWWGDVVMLTSDTAKPWYINTNLLGNKASQLANNSTNFAFPVTEATTVTNEATNANANEAGSSGDGYIYSSLTGSGAKYNVKWALPAGVIVKSVIIYRGYTSTNTTKTAEEIITKGTPHDTGMYVRTGDYTLNISGLESGKTEHVVTRITYTVGGAEHTLTSQPKSYPVNA